MAGIPCFVLGGEKIPPAICEQLGSEQYPIRIAGQKALDRWLREKKDARVGVLLEMATLEPDPEIRTWIRVTVREVILEQLQGDGPGFLGIVMGLDPDGVRIDGTVSGLAAEKAGLMPGDLILKVEDKEVGGATARSVFREMISKLSPGDRVHLWVSRDGEMKEWEVVLSGHPWSVPTLDGALDPAREEEAKEARFSQWLKEEAARQNPSS
ncbi:putative metalloprotease with PDZ domain [Haloferula luteola]|uniref:Putative metalloprotease with PDZ domain n=1 Tax=Haloferula luteola TaxID=595692 RepID=A0A840V8S6_9BACT|nr:PDZ domain-containing protein [Haloferula luteola]MBB5350360.1 putative metalloprotease with PDZ domain [Haloferula luteola]